MIRIRRAGERGHANHGWLETYHTFSFASYQDPAHTQFRALRVMNEDWVQPGKGFGTHPHQDMEIVTYVLQGALEHRDSMGNGQVLSPGEFQRMSAGTGITHSEFNPSGSEVAHLYQIWLYPERRGIEPSYEQKRFAPAERQNRLRLVASPDASEGSLIIHQDARIYLANIDAGIEIPHPIAPGRHAWLQVLRGVITLSGAQSEQEFAGGEALSAGDGAAVSDESLLDITAVDEAEIILFDLA